MSKKLTTKDQLRIEATWPGMPDFIELIDRQTVKVLADGNWHIITFRDVARYIKRGINGKSGIGVLGTIFGEWRYIDEIAQDLWNGIFTVVNYKKECLEVIKK